MTGSNDTWIGSHCWRLSRDPLMRNSDAQCVSGSGKPHLAHQLKRRRVQLTDAERKTLAERARNWAASAAEVATMAKPDTILAMALHAAPPRGGPLPAVQALGRPRIGGTRSWRPWWCGWPARIAPGAMTASLAPWPTWAIASGPDRGQHPQAPRHPTRSARKTTVPGGSSSVCTWTCWGHRLLTSEVWTWCGLMMAALLCSSTSVVARYMEQA